MGNEPLNSNTSRDMTTGVDATLRAATLSFRKAGIGPVLVCPGKVATAMLGSSVLARPTGVSSCGWNFLRQKSQ